MSHAHAICTHARHPGIWQAGGEPVEEDADEDALAEDLLSDFEVELPDSYDTLSAEASAPHEDTQSMDPRD